MNPIILLLLFLISPVHAQSSENAPVEPVPAFEEQARTLMDNGREALTQGDNTAATQIFNQLLNLPPNAYSQDAQELIGLARERNGETAKARMEYKLYLQLYPQGEGTERVRQRLANLEAPPAATPRLKQPAVVKPRQEWSVYGSFSQYYYGGSLHSQTSTTSGAIVDTVTTDITDQSALTSSLDLSGRYRTDTYDNRLVLRESYTKNFLSGQSDKQRLSAAYYEIKNRRLDYWARLGRQSGNSGGVMGRFDGAQGAYALTPTLRLGAATGQPAEYRIDSRRLFYGVNLDLGTYAEHWSGGLYAIEQRVDSISDRRALGGEFRYFQERGSSYALLDYDIGFNRLNIAMWQANWQGKSGASANALVDVRRTPSLQASNVFAGETTTSMNALLQTVDETEIRRRAKALTATAYFYQLGMTYPLSSRWQVGGDARISYVTGTPGSGTQPATLSTGSVYTYALQAVRNGLLTPRDILVSNFSMIIAPSYLGQSLSLNHVAILQEKWTLDSSLRYYAQRDETGSHMKRLTPALRTAYKWKDELTLETEIGLEKSRTQNATETDDTGRWFFFLGYRWDI